MHAVVVVMQIPSSFTDLTTEFHNFEVHVGNNVNYEHNQTCDGGPWLVGDPSSSNAGLVEDPHTSSNTWGWGKEVWCNMQGKYVHLVADMSS